MKKKEISGVKQKDMERKIGVKGLELELSNVAMKKSRKRNKNVHTFFTIHTYTYVFSISEILSDYVEVLYSDRTDS